MHLSKAEMKAIVEASAAGPRRKARNISLDDQQFERFQAHCEAEGLAPNKVIDMLIAAFLKAASKENED